jgi:hypothetical protein
MATMRNSPPLSTSLHYGNTCRSPGWQRQHCRILSRFGVSGHRTVLTMLMWKYLISLRELKDKRESQDTGRVNGWHTPLVEKGVNCCSVLQHECPRDTRSQAQRLCCSLDLDGPQKPMYYSLVLIVLLEVVEVLREGHCGRSLGHWGCAWTGLWDRGPFFFLLCPSLMTKWAYLLFHVFPLWCVFMPQAQK